MGAGRGMRLRTKLCFGLSALFLGLFLLGISAPGQRYLTGTPSSDPGIYEGQVVGAALAPYFYFLVPSIALLISSVILLFVGRRRGGKAS
jgi:hypothetical protein